MSQNKYTVAMVLVSGEKIRRLRESQELTQLYLATAVEVTAETISRWERAGTPTIKKDNALKLATALQVDLSAILADRETEEAADSQEDVATGPAITTGRLPVLGGKKLLALLLLAGVTTLLTTLWLIRPSGKIPTIRAERFLPSHTAAGQPFPVIIRITAEGGTSGSFLVQESLPFGCRVVSSSPQAILKEQQVIKWIQKEGGNGIFSYLAVAENTKETTDEALIFSGTVKLRQKNYKELVTGGHSRLLLQPYHWADTNRDNRISDEEILAVYDDFAKVKDLPVDIDQIEEMWLGESYVFNKERNVFEIHEE
jgi:transcriptional regulator with XRE-family HTH domain